MILPQLYPHRKSEAHSVPRATDLPEHGGVRALMNAHGINSALLLPLMHDGVNTGTSGFVKTNHASGVFSPEYESCRFRRLDRTERSITGILLRCNCTAKTPPKRSAEARHEARNRFRSMEVLYDQLYRTDPHDGVFTREYRNPPVTRIVEMFANGNHGALSVHFWYDDGTISRRAAAWNNPV